MLSYKYVFVSEIGITRYPILKTGIDLELHKYRHIPSFNVCYDAGLL